MTPENKKMLIMFIIGAGVALAGFFIYQKSQEDKHTVSLTIDTNNPSITLDKE